MFESEFPNPRLREAQSLANGLPALVQATGQMTAGLALPPFVLRSSITDDVTAIGALLRDCYARGLADDYHANVLAAALPVISSPKESLIRSGSYFVADSGAGRLIAAGGWSWRGPVGGVAPRDTAHIRHLVVDLACTGRGIGRLLLDHVMAHARSHGVSRLICTSTTTAAGFYEACGFERRCDVHLTLGPGLSFPAVQMSKAL